MTYYRKYFTAGAVILLLTSLVAPASALPAVQSISCTMLPSPTQTLRAEGLSEEIGSLAFRCVPAGGRLARFAATGDRSGSVGGTFGSLTLLFNANITNVPDADGMLQDVLLTAGPLGAKDARADRIEYTSTPALRGTNGLQFEKVVFAGDGAGALITITGIRVAASQVSAGQFGAFLQVSVAPAAYATDGFPGVPIFMEGGVSQFNVARVLRGLGVAVEKVGSDFLQCVSPIAISAAGSDAPKPMAAITFTEQFPTAFQAEGTEDFNLRTVGTRLIARFSDIPAGARIFVTTGPVASKAPPTVSVLSAVLVDVNDATGSAGTPAFGGVAPDAFTGSKQPYKEVPIASGAGYATWEITGAGRADASESLKFGILVAYTPDFTADRPALGTGAVRGNFAPISAIATPSATAPVPRFVDSGAEPEELFTIDACRTTLLFPYVSNTDSEEYDTGISIANTNDPRGDSAQSGVCTISYYGENAPEAQTTSKPVPAGSILAFSFDQGNSDYGIAAARGFTGYMVATCNFNNARGFAFISDLGSDEMAMGYLAQASGAGR